MGSKLLLQVRKKVTIEMAWAAIQRNARTSKSQQTKNEVEEFAAELSTNLGRIRDQLRGSKFIFLPARGVKIPKDKKKRSEFRPLVVAKVESRIVQRAIHDVLVAHPAIAQYVRTPHSFGGVKKDQDEIAAVPAAIKAVLAAIGQGGSYVIRSDISQFFTRIPKSLVTRIVAGAVQDEEFMQLFEKAIAVELENMAALRGSASAFPIEDIGVAQGNSLSPLLGNLVLYDFDRELNKHTDVRCIRYIDDFIIVAPSKEVAENTFSKALSMLKGLGMDVSARKTKRAKVTQGFEFLGIDLANGFIRPSRRAQIRLQDSVKAAVADSLKAFREHRKSGELPSKMALIPTLTRISGITNGWGKHYRFCNDSRCFERLDEEVGKSIRSYLAAYREEREKTDEAGKWRILGIGSLAEMEREPFTWPKLGGKVIDRAA